MTLAIVLLPGMLRADPPQNPGAAPPGPTARRELIVLLADGPGAPAPEEVVESARRQEPLPAGLHSGSPQSARFALTRRAAGPARARLLAEPDSARARLERYLVLSYPAAANLEAIARALAANPFVVSVEENTSASFSVAPNDPFFPLASNPTQYQWGLHTLNFAAAWDRIKGHAYVGLVDTGVQLDHPDLRAFNPSGGYDGGNVRPHLSWDVQNSDADVDENHPPQTFVGHGTHTSGIVAATPNNGIGVAGGCWRCSLLMGKVGGSAFKTEVAEAIVWHVDHGAEVISMSLGWSTAETQGMVGDAVLFAHQRDVAMFASSGNDKIDIDFPASDPRVVAVGGIESDESLWVEEACPRPGYSGTIECGTNFTLTPGTKMQELVAPAQKVLSTFYTGKEWNPNLGCGDSTEPNAGYGLCTGTSMSSPFVAALAGLLRSANPLLSKANVRSLLIDNADRAGAWNFQFGYGVPDAALSVEKALGRAAGQVLANRLTPLFSLYSATAEDSLSTTFPQVATAAIFGLLEQSCERAPNGSCAVPAIPYSPVGPTIPGYAQFPDAGCTVSPCFVPAPRASVYVFTSDRAPYPGAPPLVPLYRLSFRGTNPANGNTLNRDVNYTTETAGILAYKQVGYELDGIEGYIYQRCSPEPSCIPAGAVRLYRLYHTGRDDHAIFPESELAEMLAAGYSSEPGANDWIGYVYPNVDSDADSVVNGFEGLIGTNPAQADSDCDGISDGNETLNFPYGDPLGSPGCATKKASFLAQSVPNPMVAGQSYPVNLTVKNTGTIPWSLVGPQCNAYRLGSVNPHGNTTWGFGRVDLAGPVAAGATATLNFTVTAPATAGTYNFQWQMVHECVEWFGDPSTNVAVVVNPNPPPTARLTFACAGLSCSFNGGGSTDNTGIVSYAWSFGDATSGSGVAPGKVYAATNPYQVTLTVTDTLGATSSVTRKVSVQGEPPLPAESYFTVPPCRLLDTRNTTILTHGQFRTVQVAGLCGIPATAKAVSINVTAISPTGQGHFQIFPGNQTSGPFLHSFLGFEPASSPRASNAILRLATNGAGTLNLLPVVPPSTGQVHATVDVYGYFSEDTAPAPGAQGPYGFQTVAPCRIADTRSSTPIAVNTTRSFTVQGVCGVPVGAAAAALNPVVIGPTAGGHASLFQAGTFPPVPTINFNAGTTLANGARIRLAPTTPDISLNYFSPIAGASTHALVDVYGYFKSDAPLQYRPITACRAVDTRSADQGGPALTAPSTRNFQIRGNCGVPLTAKAAAVSVTTVDQAGQGFLAVYPSGTSHLGASFLNYTAGQGALANGGIVALSTLPDDLAITTANATNVIVDVYGYFQ